MSHRQHRSEERRAPLHGLNPLQPRRLPKLSSNLQIQIALCFKSVMQLLSHFSKTYHMALLEPSQSKAHSARFVLIPLLMEMFRIVPPIGAVFFNDQLGFQDCQGIPYYPLSVQGIVNVE